MQKNKDIVLPKDIRGNLAKVEIYVFIYYISPYIFFQLTSIK